MTSEKPRRPAQGGKRTSPASQRRELPPSKPGEASRAAAAKLLSAVLDRKTSLDGMLDADNGNPAYKALSDADRALVRAILNTALRHLPRIEAAITSLLQTPLPDGARALKNVLTVAAAQILYLDVPDHSAVDLAVEQANADPRNRRFAALVNALLRRMSREKADILERIKDVPAMPDWFFKRLVSAYGTDTARAIAEAQLTPAAIDLTVKADAAGWAEKLNGTVLPTGGIRLAGFEGSVTALPGYEDGVWWVQDAAASLPARLFGDLTGKTAVDLCAAPGGKTAQLVLAGADVTALDMSANRLKRLERNLERLKLQARTAESNAGDFQSDELFDVALLDAPCSSTGTTRRHPDVLWVKDEADIVKLAGVQERLLRHALTLVKPGGRVVFSNCSLDPLEGEAVVSRILADTPGIERVPVDAADWPGLEAAVTPEGALRTTPAMLTLDAPFASGLDGFYAVVLRRMT